jgi:hypothetical protein
MPIQQDLLSKGYLPKELPTPFTSAGLSAVPMPLGVPPGYGDTQLVLHKLARPGLLTRSLGIPHPLYFTRLADVIGTHWPDIEARIAASTMSLTAPVVIAGSQRAVVAATTRDRLDERAYHRATARYMVKADVSQWYPSIYTHSLAWAAHGKAAARAAWRARRLGRLWGNALDVNVRNAQSQQTVGIPIGPDTSFVLGELVLAEVDGSLRSKRRAFPGFRYFDDYELYASSAQEADLMLSPDPPVAYG